MPSLPLPPLMFVVPLYRILSSFSLLNSPWALMVADSTIVLPLLCAQAGPVVRRSRLRMTVRCIALPPAYAFERGSSVARPLFRRFMNLFSTSNQKGAPSEIARTVISHPIK